MLEDFLCIRQSKKMQGAVYLSGAKNAALPILASLILTEGISTLYNVPNSSDISCMLSLLSDLGAEVQFDTIQGKLVIDTSTLTKWEVPIEVMSKMRASFLVIGPLLARFGKAHVALPGGCVIGARPIDYHLAGLRAMGVEIFENRPYITAYCNERNLTRSSRFVLEYPSIGATEVLLMFATRISGETVIINAALEPEVFDLIDVLKKMGAHIDYLPGAAICVKGGMPLSPVTHSVIPDRLEAGALLLASAVTRGNLHIPNARADHMDSFLEKLKAMGHRILVGTDATIEFPLQGIKLEACQNPQAVSIKTGPYPSFPTDLQAPMTAALCLANGVSVVEETVFENRLMHVKELQKMGAQITAFENRATVRGVENLYGCSVIASDIRASYALVLAGLAAEGETVMSGIKHWRRGYDQLEKKLNLLGASVELISN